MSNASLTLLSLSGNAISDRGAKAFADLVLSGAALTALNLAFNCIQVKGAQAISIALQHNVSLTKLSLEENHLTDEGARLLAGSLEMNTHLTLLILWFPKVPLHGMEDYVRQPPQSLTLAKLIQNPQTHMHTTHAHARAHNIILTGNNH